MASDTELTRAGRYPRGPAVARVYDYLLGGADNGEADRDLARRLLEICAQLRAAARANRAFIDRAVTWAAGQGVDQFLDLGAGVPMARGPGHGTALPEVHETARAASPGARVAYVDADPRVVLHRRCRQSGAGLAVAEADLADPGAVLAHPAVRSVIDRAKPMCVILGLVPGLLPAARAREVAAGYAGLVAPGSVIVLSCLRCDDNVMWKELSAAWTAADLRNHTAEEIAGFLGSFDLAEPGIVVARGWRGDMPGARVAPGAPVYVLGGAARKR